MVKYKVLIERITIYVNPNDQLTLEQAYTYCKRHKYKIIKAEQKYNRRNAAIVAERIVKPKRDA